MKLIFAVLLALGGRSLLWAGQNAAPGLYIVQEGDTLWDIAELRFGDPFRWRSIYKANEKLIKNPKRIIPGWELDIPETTATLKEAPVEASVPVSAGPKARVEIVGPDMPKGPLESSAVSSGTSLMTGLPEPARAEEKNAAGGQAQPVKQETGSGQPPSGQLISSAAVSGGAGKEAETKIESVNLRGKLPAKRVLGIRSASNIKSDLLSEEMPVDVEGGFPSLKTLLVPGNWRDDGKVVFTGGDAEFPQMAVKGDTIKIRLRSGVGAAAGDLFGVYRRGNYFRNKQGKATLLELQKAGILKLTKVKGTEAEALVIKINDSVEVNNVLKKELSPE